MTRTARRSLLPTVLVVATAVILAAVGFQRLENADDGNLPDGVYRCRGEIAEVELEVELGGRRAVEIYYHVGAEADTDLVTTDHWYTVDETVSCRNTDILLTVKKGDIWGGKTTCRVKVNGGTVAESETTGQASCIVAAKLILP